MITRVAKVMVPVGIIDALICGGPRWRPRRSAERSRYGWQSDSWLCSGPEWCSVLGGRRRLAQLRRDLLPRFPS